MNAAAFRVAELEAAPGSTTAGYCRVDVGSTILSLPIAIINGARPGPVLAVTAGIHGGEYVSILAAREFAASLDAAALSGTVVVSLQSSPVSFLERAAFVNPLDGENLNRSFPGDPEGGPTARLAHWLWTNVMSRADYYVDCHTGDLPESLDPFTGVALSGDAKVEARAFAMASCFPVARTITTTTTGTTITTAARAGIPAVLVELGQRGLWTVDEVRGQRDGLIALTAHLGLTESAGAAPTEPLPVFESAAGLTSEHEGLWFPRVLPGDPVTAGSVIGTIEDAFGAEVAVITSPADGVYAYGLTSLAIRTGDFIAAIVRPSAR